MTPLRPRCRSLLAASASLFAVAPLGAQTATTAPRPAVLGGGDAIVAGSFAGGALAAHTLDRRLAERLQRPHVQENRALHRTATIARLAAQPGVVIALPTVWAVGRLFDRPTLADVGLHGSESVVASIVGVNVVKLLVGRARPAVNVHDPNSVGLLRGMTEGEEYRSFPSGHTATAFAVASALTAEVMRRQPDARWGAGVPLYAAASLVGWSRMYDNRHWASDVVAGAGFGTVAGLAVVRYQHTRPGNRVDRWFLGASVGANGVVPLVAPMRGPTR